MLRLRILSALVLVPVVAIVVLLGRPWLDIGVAVLAFLAALEVFGLLRSAGVPAETLLWPALVTVFVVALPRFLSSADWPPLPWLAVIVAAVMFVGCAAWLRRDVPRGEFPKWLAGLYGIFYPTLLTFLLVIVVVAPPIPATAAFAGVLDPGRVWLVILVAIVWAFDTGAYVTGRLFPRGRFMAFISPSKTWSGVIGGAVAATVVGAVLTAATGHAATDGALVGLVVGVAGQLGDLAESALKRAAGAKDSGTLIPGHGGILDRVDSFLFAAPVLCIYLVSLDHLT